MSERIDAHQHYWVVARGDYGWMGPHVEPIRRDFLPADLTPHREAAGIARTVVVQAAPTLAETEFLLDLAKQEPSIAGVVGWVDLRATDAVATLKRLARTEKFKGIRPMLQDIEDTFDILAGTSDTREQIEAGVKAEAIARSWEPAVAGFDAVRRKFLLYE